MFRNMNKLILLLASLFAMTGCDFAHNPDHPNWLNVSPATLTISPAFSSEEQQAVMAAGDQWQAQTNGHVALKYQIGGSSELYIGPSDGSDMAPKHVGEASGAPGPDCSIKVKVAALETMAPQAGVDYAVTLQVVAEHELGHCFGLEHVDSGLMRPDFLPTTADIVIDQRALDALCGWRGDCSE